MAAYFDPTSWLVSCIKLWLHPLSQTRARYPAFISQSIAIIDLSSHEYGCILQPIIMRGILYQSINQKIFNLSRHACKLQVNIMSGILYQSINQSINQSIYDLSRHACILPANIICCILYQPINPSIIFFPNQLIRNTYTL